MTGTFRVMVLFALATALRAEIVVYTTRAGFYANTQNPQVTTFEGIAPAGGYFDTCGNLTLNGVHFIGAAAGGAVRCGATLVTSSTYSYLNAIFNWGTGDTLQGDRFGYFDSSGTPSGYLEAVLPVNTYAFGTDLTVTGTDGNRVGQVQLDVWTGGTDTQFIFTADTTTSAAFVGFVSTQAVDSFQFRTLGLGASSQYGGFDNFTVASTGVAATPEPGTFVLFGLGVCGAVIRRWSTSASAAARILRS